MRNFRARDSWQLSINCLPTQLNLFSPTTSNNTQFLYLRIKSASFRQKWDEVYEWNVKGTFGRSSREMYLSSFTKNMFCSDLKGAKRSAGQNSLPIHFSCPCWTIHSFIHSFIHPSIHSFTHSFTHSFIHSFTQSFIRSFVRSFVHSFVYSFIHSFIHSFIRSFIRSFISFFHSFIFHSFH